MKAIQVAGCLGCAEVVKVKGGYDVIISIPFVTKDIAQDICKELIESGLVEDKKPKELPDICKCGELICNNKEKKEHKCDKTN